MPLRFPRTTYATWQEAVRDLSNLLSSVINDDAQPARYRSMRIPLGLKPIGLEQGAGLDEPDIAQFRDNGSGSTGVFAASFGNVIEEEITFSVELPEDYAEFTDLTPQIHWSPGSSTSTNTVRWGLEYTLSNVEAAFGTTTIIYAEQAGSGTAYQHQHKSFAAIDGSALTNEAVLVGRFFRDPGHANDDFPADAFAFDIRLIYECDTNRGAHLKDAKWPES